MDGGAAESASPNSPSNFSSQRHFYLAVDRLQFKMETLVDLLGMAGRRPCLPMVVCCNTRDELDAISYALSNLSEVGTVLIRILMVDPSALTRCIQGPRLYEPIHGSAPDIAGMDKANPPATVLSAAMLLKYGLVEEKAAQRIELAVLRIL